MSFTMVLSHNVFNTESISCSGGHTGRSYITVHTVQAQSTDSYFVYSSVDGEALHQSFDMTRKHVAYFCIFLLDTKTVTSKDHFCMSSS